MPSLLFIKEKKNVERNERQQLHGPKDRAKMHQNVGGDWAAQPMSAPNSHAKHGVVSHPPTP